MGPNICTCPPNWTGNICDEGEKISQFCIASLDKPRLFLILAFHTQHAQSCNVIWSKAAIGSYGTECHDNVSASLGIRVLCTRNHKLKLPRTQILWLTY